MGKFSYKLVKAFCGVDIDALDNELTRLRLENSRISELLRSTSREYNSLNDKYKKAKDSISEFGSANENNENELAECRQKIADMTAENESLKSASASDKEKLDVLQKKFDELLAVNSSMTSDVEKLSSDILGLKTELEEASREKLNVEKENKELAVNIEDYNKKNTELLNTIESLNTALNTAKEDGLDSNQKLTKEIEALNEELTSTRESRNALQSELDIIKKEMVSLDSSLEKLKAEKVEMATSFDSEKSENDTLVKSLKEEVSAAHARMEELKAESEKNQVLIEKLQVEKECMMKEQQQLLEKTILENKGIIEEKEILLEEKRQLLEKAEQEKSNILEDKKQQIEKLQLEKESVLKEKNRLDDELKSCKGNLEVELKKSSENISALNSELSEKSQSLDKALAEIQSLKKELEDVLTLKEELEDALNKKGISEASMNETMEETAQIETSGTENYSNENDINTVIAEGINEIQTAEEPVAVTPVEETEQAATDREELEKEKLNSEIVSLTREYDYVRVTTKTGNQYIYQSKHLQLKAGLFDWGIEGKEIITDETLFLTNDCVDKMEGLTSPFDSEELVCDLNNEESAQQLVETLLMAICTYQPIQINYHDKNGRTTTKNLYYVSFQPTANKFKLPYKNIFKDMLEENINTDHISAMCPHNPEPRNFAISQIGTIRRYNAYFTTPEGIEAMREGIKLAQNAEQPELVEILSSKLPL